MRIGRASQNRFFLDIPSSRLAIKLTLLGIAVWLGIAWAVTAEAPTGAATPHWWRGNLHAHTLWSDGDGFPEMVAEWYRNHGYHFLALTDHNLLSQGMRWKTVKDITSRAKTDALSAYLGRFGAHWVETRGMSSPEAGEVRLKPFDEYRATVEELDRFLLMQAEEITHSAGNGRAFHINSINLAEAIQPLDGATAREAIAANLQAAQASADRHGREVLLAINHPNYKWGLTAEDIAAAEGTTFFEVWNGVDSDSDPGDESHPSTDEIWDIANTLRIAGMGAPPLYGLATDDSHDHHGNKTRALPGRAWVMVRSLSLSPESVIRAMRAGDFYASTGVILEDISYNSKERKLTLRIQPAGEETFVTRFIGTRKGAGLKGKARVDKEGRILETTLDYRNPEGPAIGEVFLETRGLNPVCTLRGDELYVRAVVTSSAATEVPSSEFRFKRAWTEPVGWQEKRPEKP